MRISFYSGSTFLTSSCLAALLFTGAKPASSQNTIPADAGATCAVSQSEFEGWHAGGTNANPVFAAPDGFGAQFTEPCQFFKWGAQTFLWLTSSAQEDYVFDQSGFFDVVHDDQGTEKIAKVKVTPNGQGHPNIFALRGVKSDIRGGSGQAGGGGALVSQKGSLTYYGMHVNDAYVAFRHGMSEDPEAFNFTDAKNTQEFQFPSTAEAITQIVKYGRASGIIDGDGSVAQLAGTLEVKTSWVKADTVDRDAFVIVTAQVPKFDTSLDTVWAADGTESIELAMVGMHIAAPVTGHPELAWITYEHLSNTPIGAYLYTDTSGAAATYDYNSDGTWTFAKSGASGQGNMVPNASVNAAGDIQAAEGKTVSAQDIVLFNPWGLAPMTANDLANNTDLVSLNASLIALLGADENACDKYFQVGGIWTDGTLPKYQDYDIEVGGLDLANSTMESFHQFGAQKPADFTPRNCFDCHSVSGDNASAPEHNLGVSVSHIFQGMKPYTP
ncbi:MAG: hypothetical protein P8Q26_02430 [Ascidiaceihabitans sp.]|nr:hypothetical protein [Ascidiaceihabitans sp.]